MKMTNEMIKGIAIEVLKNKKSLEKACIADIGSLCKKYANGDWENRDLFEYCDDIYEFENKVESDIEEYVKEYIADYSDKTWDFFYETAKKVLKAEGQDIDDYDFDWDEMEILIKEMTFKTVEGKDYKYEDFSEMVYDLGDEAFDVPDLSDEWIEYEDDMKSYGNDNGSGWSPAW